MAMKTACRQEEIEISLEEYLFRNIKHKKADLYVKTQSLYLKNITFVNIMKPHMLSVHHRRYALNPKANPGPRDLPPCRV